MEPPGFPRQAPEELMDEMFGKLEPRKATEEEIDEVFGKLF
jgi:hypothetical protein